MSLGGVRSCLQLFSTEPQALFDSAIVLMTGIAPHRGHRLQARSQIALRIA
jgi:hypothetical protein